jgi:hypothetical protein
VDKERQRVCEGDLVAHVFVHHSALVLCLARICNNSPHSLVELTYYIHVCNEVAFANRLPFR